MIPTPYLLISKAILIYKFMNYSQQENTYIVCLQYLIQNIKKLMNFV